MLELILDRNLSRMENNKNNGNKKYPRENKRNERADEINSPDR
jgi:hypothetical protein